MKSIQFRIAFALIAPLLALSAQALELSANGLGQVLIYPYYTVNANQDSWFTVDNTSEWSIVTHVRVLEGNKGRPVADIDVYLGPYDVWTAAITRASSGDGAILLSADESCTRPAIPAAGLALSSAGYDGSGSLPADTGPQGISHTREGSIEVFAGAQITNGSATDNAIRPGPDGSANCASLPESPYPDFIGTAIGIYGTASVINVGEGTLYSYTPQAITHFTEVPLMSADNGPLEPSLAQANSSESEAGGAVAYVVSENPSGRRPEGPFRFDFAHGIDAVSALFMSDALYNEYLVTPELGAATDWVVTFPTRRFYVDPVYGFSDGFGNAEDLGYSDPGLIGGFYAHVNDRKGGVTYPARQTLAWNTNVISFRADAPTGSASAVFGSHLNINVPPLGGEGVVRLLFSPQDASLSASILPGQPVTGARLLGQPAIGFMAYKVINDHAQPGLLANYAGTFAHRNSTCSMFQPFFNFVCLRQPQP